MFYLFFAVLREFMGQPRVEVIQEGSNFAGNISPGNSVVLGCKSPVGHGSNKAYVGRQGKKEIVFLCLPISTSINFVQVNSSKKKIGSLHFLFSFSNVVAKHEFDPICCYS